MPGIDTGIERLEFGGKRAVRKRIHLQRDRKTGPQLRRIARGQREIHIELRQILQRGDHCAGGYVIAEIDAANTDAAGKRCKDPLVADTRLGFRELRPRALEIGPAAIELGLRNGFLRNQLEIALVEDFRQVQGGDLVLAAGLLHVVVEHQQQLAGLDSVTGIEIQRGDLAAGFRTEIDPAHGLDGADRIQVMAPGFAGCDRGRDGHRRRRKIRTGQLAETHILIAANRPEYRKQQNNDDQVGAHDRYPVGGRDGSLLLSGEIFSDVARKMRFATAIDELTARS